MIHSRVWREQDLQRRLQIWEPLIGSQATTTATRGRWLGQRGAIVLISWVALTITFEATDMTGVPIIIATLVEFPLALYLLITSARLILRASKEAGLVAGTSAKARPPVRNVNDFERWRSRSQYSKHKT